MPSQYSDMTKLVSPEVFEFKPYLDLATNCTAEELVGMFRKVNLQLVDSYLRDNENDLTEALLNEDLIGAALSIKRGSDAQ